MGANWAATEGSPRPLGVTWLQEEKAYNFAIYSKYATAVTLLLYSDADPTSVNEKKFDPLKNKSGRVWHMRMPERDLEGAHYYGYRVEGPNDPSSGQRFDQFKILLDPYATSVYFPPDFSRNAAMGPGSNAGRAPLGIINSSRATFDWGGDQCPRHTSDAIICEIHVRGCTQRENSGVAVERRGTYAGLAEKIPYLKDLGVTIVELMPVMQFDPQEKNYWGYMPLSFFSPHQRYSSTKDAVDQIAEFRQMVKSFHEAV